MLTQLHILNFLLIEELDISFGPGLTVLTGETGAGKSILIDALGLALGDRSNGKCLRDTDQLCDITAEFDLSELPEARAWLTAQDLDPSCCILRRTITAENRSRLTINARACPLSTVRELATLLLSIHGQHQQYALLAAPKQLSLLDQAAKHDPLQQKTATAYADLKNARAKLEALQVALEGGSNRLDFLRYQFEELERVDCQPGEVEALHDAHRKLSQSDRLRDIAEQSLSTLDGELDGSIMMQLADILHNLTGKPAFQETFELLEQTNLLANEASAALNKFTNQLDADPSKLQTLETRLNTLHDTARKHRIEPEQLPEKTTELRTQLEQFEAGEEALVQLETELKDAQSTYTQRANQLHQSRTKAAKSLGDAMTKRLPGLALPHGKIAFQVIQDPAREHQTGQDTVQMIASMNPGQTPGPLGEIASGGELSRISLIAQLLCNTQGHASMIFDEVDTGISGATAETVGQLLREVAGHRQALCVTHLPQVAACGHQHYKVEKTVKDKQTHLRINQLNPDEQTLEIARLLGGKTISDATLANAKDLLDSAHEIR